MAALALILVAVLGVGLMLLYVKFLSLQRAVLRIREVLSQAGPNLARRIEEGGSAVVIGDERFEEEAS